MPLAPGSRVGYAARDDESNCIDNQPIVTSTNGAPVVRLHPRQRNGTLYTGVTADLSRRVWQHREAKTGFTAKYGVTKLVWYQEFAEVDQAIVYENRIKRWRRAWKLQLIEAENPQWLDLYESWNC